MHADPVWLKSIHEVPRIVSKTTKFRIPFIAIDKIQQLWNLEPKSKCNHTSGFVHRPNLKCAPVYSMFNFKKRRFRHIFHSLFIFYNGCKCNSSYESGRRGRCQALFFQTTGEWSFLWVATRTCRSSLTKKWCDARTVRALVSSHELSALILCDRRDTPFQVTHWQCRYLMSIRKFKKILL